MVSNKNLLGILGLLFLLSVSNACFTADTPGTVYTLTGDLTGTKADGACITIAANDVTIDCDGYSITGDSTGNGIYSAGVQNITITDCTISNYEYGIYSSSTHNSYFINNEVYNTIANIILTSSNDNTLTSNTAHDSSSYGFYIYGSQYNNLEGNTAYNNGHTGFLVYYSSDNILYDNNAYDNTRVGFYIIYSDNTDMDLATTQGSQYGFYIRGSNNVNLASGASHSNHYSAGNAYGLYLIGPGTVDITDVHLYNQSAGSDSDFYVVGDAVDSTIVSIQNMTIDNPQGNFEDYTRINIYDVVDLGTSYSIEWSAEPATLPSSYDSFEQKYVQISGSTVINGIAFYWLDSESSGHDENEFELWRYDTSGWTNTNANLNTGGNYLSLSNVNPGVSTYGILEYVSAPPSDTCKVIDSPGSYQLSSNVVGAPIIFDSGSPTIGNNACIVITSSNVDFSCNGYSITNDGTPDATGIVINGLTSSAYTNVTVRDCSYVSGYDNGILLLNSDFNNLIGNTVYDNIRGFYLVSSEHNTITDNTAHNNAVSDFYLHYSFSNTLMNNFVYNSYKAFSGLTSSVYHANNIYVNNTIRNNQYGFEVPESYSSFIGNTVDQVANAFFCSGSYNVFDDNDVIISYAGAGTGNGFYIYGSYNNITNNVVHNATYGFTTTGTGNRFVDNSAHGSPTGAPGYPAGFYAYHDTNSVFIDNRAYYIPIGFQTWGSTNIIISGTQVYNTGVYGLLIRTPKVATISNTYIQSNGPYDLYVDNYATGKINTTLNMSHIVIAGPTVQDTAIFFINDDLTVDDWYYLAWGEQIPPPATHFSFKQKYVEIVPLRLPSSISMIRWGWGDAELSGYDESKFELWRYNGIAWINVSGQTLDTTLNYIELSDYTLPSVTGYDMTYAILQNNNSAPSIAIESPADNTGTSSTDLNYTVDDVNTASCWYYLDGTGPIALPGCANTSLGYLEEGSHTLTLVVNDTFGEQTSTTVYFVYDTTPPTVSSINSPTNSTYYNAPITIDLEFTVSDNLGVDSCWYYLDGTGPIALPGCANTTLGPLEEGQHNVAVYVSDTAGNIDYAEVYFSVVAGPEGCATLEVEAINHLVQCGTNPGSYKVPLADISVCVYDKSPESCAANIGVSHHNYEAIWNNCEPVNCAKTNELGIADIPLPAGDYIVISIDATKTVLESPLGVSASDFQCAVETTMPYPVTMYKHLQQITKCDGKKVPGKTSKVQGSELLIIEPEYVLWDSTEELFPILFESSENWVISAYLETPEGYVPDYESLSTATSGYKVIQFTVTEVGSVPDDVGVTLDLTDPHGNSIIHRSQIGTRLSENLAKAKGVAVNKNGVIVGKGKAVGHKTAPLGDWTSILFVMTIGVGVIALAAFERSRRIEKKVSKDKKASK